MPQRDPAKVARKWSQRLQGARQDIIDGVQAVTTAPGELAVAKQDTLKARFNQAVDSGKWANNTRAVGLAGWQTPMIQKGADRAVEGARLGEQKMQMVMSELLPFVNQASQQVRQMPNATDAEREQRALAFIRLMRQFRRTRRV